MGICEELHDLVAGKVWDLPGYLPTAIIFVPGSDGEQDGSVL